MTYIEDINDKRLDVFLRLNESALRKGYHLGHKGIFIAESPKVIRRAMEYGAKPLAMLVSETDANGECRDIIEELPDACEVYTASEEVLSSIRGFKLNRGALVAFARPEFQGVDLFLENIIDYKNKLKMERCDKKPSAISVNIDGKDKSSLFDKLRLVVLEDVVNPTNVGAIFRSAAALNMDGIIITSNSSDPLSKRAIRVSMGTVFQIPWTYIDSDTWYDKGIDILTDSGVKTVSMALREDTVDITDETLKSEPSLAIIMGTEGEGLREATINNSDYTVKLPMREIVDSLNVAQAATIAFWELGEK